MEALGTWAFLYSTFARAGKDLNKEDEMCEKVFDEMQEAIGKFMDAQRFAEIAQEQLCDSRDRCEKDC